MTVKDIYNELVIPVCALEEVVSNGKDVSPVIEVISMALRKVLNDAEEASKNV